MPTSRHLPCVAYFTCPRSRLNSPSARLFLIDRINEHKSGKKPLITARSLLAWSGCPRWRVVGKRVSQVAQTDCVRNRAKWNVAARFRPTSRGAVRLAVRDQSRCRIRLQSINNNIQFWVFKRQRFVYRLRYRSSFHQNENFIEEIESLLASLENFTIKKKKKLISRLWKSRPRTNFRISFLGEDSKPQSRAAESAQLSRAFLFLCTFPSLPTRASQRSPTRASEAPFLRRVVRS